MGKHRISYVFEDNGTKTCRDCGVEKPFADFYRNAFAPGGLKHECKKCAYVRAMEREKSGIKPHPRGSASVRHNKSGRNRTPHVQTISLPNEEWRSVANHPNYEVSSAG